MARPKVAEELKLKRRSYTSSDLLEERLDKLTDRTAFDKVEIVRAAILYAIDTFEEDTSVILRMLEPAPKDQPEGGE